MSKRCCDCNSYLNKPYSRFCKWASWIEAGWNADICKHYSPNRRTRLKNWLKSPWRKFKAWAFYKPNEEHESMYDE